MEIAVLIFSTILILLGLVGSFLPILPGPPLSYVGFLIYAWYTGFDKIGATPLIVFAVLTAFSAVFDLIAPGLAAKGYKASRYGVIGSILGAFVGVMTLGPLGILIGPFAGGFIGELMHAYNLERAGQVAWAAFIGFVVSSVVRFGVIIGMLVYMYYAAIRFS